MTDSQSSPPAHGAEVFVTPAMMLVPAMVLTPFDHLIAVPKGKQGISVGAEHVEGQPAVCIGIVDKDGQHMIGVLPIPNALEFAEQFNAVCDRINHGEFDAPARQQ